MSSGSTLVARAMIAAAAIALMTNASIAQAPPHRPSPAMRHLLEGATLDARNNYGFFPAYEPASSNRVGLFVARRTPDGDASLFYCSMPADPSANGANSCKEVKGFPK